VVIRGKRFMSVMPTDQNLSQRTSNSSSSKASSIESAYSSKRKLALQDLQSK
jgi:hypothetical protein